MPIMSLWGTINATLLEPLDYVDSSWGGVSVVLDAAYSSGAVPSVYDQNTHTWVTVQPVVWDEGTQEWVTE